MFFLSPVSFGLSNAFHHLDSNKEDLGVDKECEEYPPTAQSQPFGGRKLGVMLDLLNESSTESAKSQGRASPYHTDVSSVTLARKNSTFST